MFASWREEDVLTGFLFLSVLCHGMFFVREWLVLGVPLILYLGLSWYKHLKQSENLSSDISMQERELFGGSVWIFCLLIILSLIGLFHPVRSLEGWLEAYRWLLFLAAYLWGRRFALDQEIGNTLITKIVGVSFLCILITWLPGSEMVWVSPGVPEAGRFSASFGYPNAAAVYIGSMLLLLFKDRNVNWVFVSAAVISVVSTGSRAGLILLVFFSALLIVKRMVLKMKDSRKVNAQGILGFYTGMMWTESLTIIFMILLLQQTAYRCQGSLVHLLDWTGTSFVERTIYYWDSIKLAWYAHFLPRAGGWLAFPFVQTIPYWTLDPHSSFCRILLNQGLAGVLLVGFWAIRGLKVYIADLVKGKDLAQICSKTAVVYLGLHSLIDVDMSFGALGIVFWLLVGMNSK